MNCLFIYNPSSGKGKILKYINYIETKLKTTYEKVVTIQSHYKNNSKEIIERIGEDYDTVVVAGGDGTLNEVINAIMHLKKQPTIGYIPMGTVNDVAHSLKIPRNIKKAVNVILKGKVFNHDIFKVNDNYGIYVCTTGLFTEASYATSQSVKRSFGKLAYFVHGAKRVFTSHPMHVKLSYEDKVIDGYYSLFLAVNSRFVAGIKVNSKANLSDGLVDVVLVHSPKKKGFSFLSLLSVLKLFLFGINYNKKKRRITYLKLKNFEISINEDSKINLDGECAFSGSFKFETIDKGVKIFVP